MTTEKYLFIFSFKTFAKVKHKKKQKVIVKYYKMLENDTKNIIFLEKI